jgi:hypothetical protein
MKQIFKFMLLLFLSFLACEQVNTPKDVLDWIKPYKENPSYWQYKGQPVLLLGGSKDDNLFQLPELKVHLDEMVAVGANFIRNTMSSRIDKGFEIYRFERRPDSMYDLNKWNDEYWQRFENMLKWTNERDIFVQIEVWDRFDYSRDHWQGCPWNPVNNVNYTSEESGLEIEYLLHPGRDVQPFFHTIPGMEKYQKKFDIIRKFQEKYVEKLLSNSLNYGNVLYCMNNETSTEPKWGQYWMNFIREKAAEKGVTVFATDMFDHGFKPEESEKIQQQFDQSELYPFIDISQVNSRNFNEIHWEKLMWYRERNKSNSRPLNNVKIYSAGQTNFGSGTPIDGVERFWRNIISGCASVRFHRPTSGIGLNDTSKACIQAMRKFTESVIPWESETRQDLLSDVETDEAYILANEGKVYGLYFTDGGSVGLNLKNAQGQFKLKWIDIFKGEWAGEATISSGAIVKIDAPGKLGWAAVITKI